MKQIEGMVADLDSDPAKKQQVFVFDFQNTDPNQAMTILQSLFPSQANGGTSNMRNNQNQAGVTKSAPPLPANAPQLVPGVSPPASAASRALVGTADRDRGPDPDFTNQFSGKRSEL